MSHVKGSRLRVFPALIPIFLFLLLFIILFGAIQLNSVQADTNGVAIVTFTKTDTIVNDVLGNGQANPGDTLQYDLTIDNTTGADLTNVMITDVIDSNLTWNGVWQSTALALNGAFTTTENTAVPITMFGNDPDGDTLTFSIVTSPTNGSLGGIMPQTAVSANVLYTPNMGFAGADSFTFQVEDDDGNTDSATININVINSDIAIAKSVAAPAPFAGSRITYTVAAGNQGGVALTNVVISDVLPATVNYFGHSTSLGSYNSGTGNWILPNIGVGITHTLTIYADINAGTVGQTITNTAVFVSMDQVDGNPNNNSQSAVFTVQSQVDIAITKTVDDNTPLEGDTIVYTISATNNGPDDATGVQVTDVLPAGVTYVSDDQASYTPPLWNIGNLNATQSATLNITATVNNMTAGNIYTNTATVTAVNETDTNPSNDSDSATLTVNLAPTAVDDNPGGLDAYQVTSGATLTVPSGPVDPVERNDVVGFPVATISNFGGGDLGGTVISNAAGATVGPIPGYTNGTLTVNADGSFVFTPPTTPTAFGGNFQFDYRLANANGTSDATVTIQVQAGPTAVNDPNGGFPANSTPPGGANPHPYHFAVNSTNNVISGANRLLQNDNLSAPPASLVSFGGGDILGTTVTTLPAGTEVVKPSGPFSLTVDASGVITFTPDTDFTGLFTFEYRLQNAIGFDDATVTMAVGNRPLCTNDAYNATGNVGITVPAGGVLLNDTGDAIAITAVQGNGANIGNPTATTASGTVTLNSNGSFSYMPPAGFNGNDTFTYDLDNNFNDPSTCTVTVTVSDMIWFIDNNAVPGGNGRLNTPFNTLAAFNAINTGPPPNAQNGNTIFIHTGSISYTEGITLTNNQILVGQGASESISAIAGITLPPNSNPLPTTGGTNPVITNANFAGSGIALATGNIVRGVTVSNTLGAGIWGPGANNTTISETAVINAGGAAVYFQSAAITTTFTTLSTDGSQSDGIVLNNVSGTFTVSGDTTVANSANEGIEIIDSTGLTASFGNTTISDAGSLSINLRNNSGNITFGTTTMTNLGSSGIIIFEGSATYQFGSTNINTWLASGRGIGIADMAGGSVTFSSVNITNPALEGIQIQNTNAPVTVNGGSISGAGTTAFYVTGGNQNVTYSGTINNSANRSVYIENHTGGIVTLNGNITDTGTGIFITNSSGINNSTTNFTGNLTLNTGNSPAFTATNGGTINISGGTNTIGATTPVSGGAININNTTIGASGVTFRSISANGADTGITLNNTGTGAFTVTGVSTTDGTGGTLQNHNDHGIELINAQNVSINNMNLINATTTQDVAVNTPTCDDESGGTNTGCNAPVQMVNATNISLTNLTINGSVQHGINGNNVNGLAITNTDLTNIGDNQLENGMHIINLLGTVNFNNLNIDGSETRNVLIENNTGTANITVTNSSFNNTTLANGEDGFHLIGGGNANVTLNVNNSSFIHNHGPQLKAHAEDNSTVNATINDNLFDGDPAEVGNTGLDLAVRDNANLIFNVSGTTLGDQVFQPIRGQVINVFALGNGTASGRINRNDINGSDQASGIRVVSSVTTSGNPNVTVEIDGNDIDGISGSGNAGIHIDSRNGVAVATGTANVQATINNNDVTITGADSIIQAYANSGNTMCLDVTNNTTAGSATSPYSPVGSTHYIGNPVAGTSGGAGNITYDGYIANNLGGTWNANGNSPTLAAGITGEAAVDGTQPTAGTCATVPAPKLATAVSPHATAKLNTSNGFTALNQMLGTIPNGKSITISFAATINDPFPDMVSAVSNQAQLTADGGINLVSDDPDTGTADDPTVTPVTIIETFLTYLPVVLNKYSNLPDLVVQSITPSANDVTVVIENIGNAPVTNAFWVDAYFNPPVPPTAVNQTIDTLNVEGIVWGVTSAALPIAPGETLTLTVSSPYYNATMSNFNGTVPAGDLYVQVDSANAATTYGAVLESHEATGGTYNNISSTTVSRSVSFVGDTKTGRDPSNSFMPKRP